MGELFEDRMRRRTLIASGLAASLLSIFGQVRAQSKPKRLALVHPSEAPERMTLEGRRTFKAFFSELIRAGLVEGANVLIDRYSALGQQERYSNVARAVVDSRPDVIVSLGGPIARQLRSLTTTIPIVTATSDPVVGGYATNLAKPDGNVTGVSVDAGLGLYGKRIQLLKETIGELKSLRLLVPESNLVFWGRDSAFAQIQEVARSEAILLDLAVVSGIVSQQAYEQVFETLKRDGVSGLLVADAAENLTHRKLIADLAASHMLPAIYPYRESVELGGLMSYGIDLAVLMRHLASIAVEVLRGAKPETIPFYQPTKFELVLNGVTARRLGLKFPPNLLATADEVIE